VEYPFSFRVRARGEIVLGSTVDVPGADVASSGTFPIPPEWWFRPVSSACLVGEHRAVVWNRLYDSPVAARRSRVGVWQGPPNALLAPKPTSSSRMIRTFGAPVGGRRSRIGGNAVSGSLASNVVRPT
jgi:hypothetical protein